MPAMIVNREIEEWRKRCPLNLWRKGRGKKVSILSIAERLGVKRQTVYWWTYGRTLPTTRLAHELRKITGITADAWIRWFDAKPSAGVRSCDSTSTAATQENGEL